MAFQGRCELAHRGLKCIKACIIEGEMHTRVCSCALALFSGIAALSLMAGCKSLPPSKPESEWTPEEARGAAVFHQACAKCHYPTTTHGLHGPGLQAITKVQAMPSGAPPTDERLTAVILHGHGTMPGTALDDPQLHDLLAYLHTL
jgi:mono/diheme cytochrome c family protein